MNQTITTSAPGRICLFGEHQDYLGLPVVAMAVNLRFYIDFRPTADKHFTILTPDLPGSEPQTLDLNAPAPRHDQDYIWGMGRVLIEEGFKFPTGGQVTFRSEIPVRAGCSSSSAMSAAWMRLLLELGEHPKRELYLKDAETVAYLVYRGEKELFGGAGGMMDQYSCYLGGLIHVYPRTETDDAGIPYHVERLAAAPAGFILIDSGEPKDTQGVLRGAADRVMRAMESVRAFFPDFDLRTAVADDLIGKPEQPHPDETTLRIVRDHIVNRDLCRLGLGMLRLGVNPQQFGELLTEEHRVLSETLGISTPLIDQVQALSLEAGAYGAKINGSGGGGTLFCYAPDHDEPVTAMLRRKELRFFRITMDDGARVEP